MRQRQPHKRTPPPQTKKNFPIFLVGENKKNNKERMKTIGKLFGGVSMKVTETFACMHDFFFDFPLDFSLSCSGKSFSGETFFPIVLE